MSEILVNKLTGVGTAGSIVVTGEGNSTTTNLQQGLAKCWAYVDGVGGGYGDSFNTSGFTDSGVGDYTITYSANMNSTAYGGGSAAASSQNNGQNFQLHIFATSSIRTRAENASGTLSDCARLTLNIHGDLA
jgi:hypothetical protein